MTEDEQARFVSSYDQHLAGAREWFANHSEEDVYDMGITLVQGMACHDQERIAFFKELGEQRLSIIAMLARFGLATLVAKGLEKTEVTP